MPRVEAPPIKPALSDIELFAKAYFNIHLTNQQLQYIAMVAAGRKHATLQFGRKHGITTANKVILAYLQEGMKPGGRVRLPQHPLPPIDKKKLKGLTQDGKILELIKRPGGAYNFELARVSLRYGASVHDLRRDGYNIVTERQYLKNGRASNTYRYRMAGE